MKKFGGPWSLYNTEEKVEAFLDEHSWCDEEHGCLEAGSHLELRFEFSADQLKELPSTVQRHNIC